MNLHTYIHVFAGACYCVCLLIVSTPFANIYAAYMYAYIYSIHVCIYNYIERYIIVILAYIIFTHLHTQ